MELGKAAIWEWLGREVDNELREQRRRVKVRPW
jgi:hypothetical protein